MSTTEAVAEALQRLIDRYESSPAVYWNWAEVKAARAVLAERIAPEPSGDVKELMGRLADKDAAQAHMTRLHDDLVAVVLDYNQMLRSFAMVASRKGEQTNWDSLNSSVQKVLAQHHETWKRYFPPMQPDDEGSIFHQCLVPVQPPTKGEK